MQRSKKLLRLITLMLVLSFGMSGVASAITNGYPDGDAHPYVGIALFQGMGASWSCSGSLVSPTVFVTAGHCTYGAELAMVWFDSNLAPLLDEYGNIVVPGYLVTPDNIHTAPGFCVGCAQGLPGYATHDAGVLVLPESVTLGSYAQLPAEGLTDDLPNKADVNIVGYGANVKTQGPPPHEWLAYGLRVFGQAEIVSTNHVISDEFLKISKNPGKDKGGTCFGDSGGPALMAGTNTMVGITSFGNNDNCTGVGYSTRVDTADILGFVNDYLD